MRKVNTLILALALHVGAGLPLALAEDGASPLDPSSAYRLAQESIKKTEGKVFRDSFRAVWQPERNQLHYRIKSSSSAWEYVVVDVGSGEVQRADDPSKLDRFGIDSNPKSRSVEQADTLPRKTKRTGEATTITFRNSLEDSVELFWISQDGERRSYGRVRPGSSNELGTYDGHVWLVCDPNGTPIGFFEATEQPTEVVIDKSQNTLSERKRQTQLDKEKEEDQENPDQISQSKMLKGRKRNISPDGRWSIELTDESIWLVDEPGEKHVVASSESKEWAYRGPVSWSPDSNFCVLKRVQEVPRRTVTVVNSSPRDQLQPKLLQYDYFKPGDPLPNVDVVLINVSTKTATTVDNHLFQNAFNPEARLSVRWSPSSREFYFDFNQRGHQTYRILAVDTLSCAARVVAEEKSDTFIDYTEKTWRHWLDESNELIWMSEQSDWAHLYLVDIATGTIKNPITKGDWVVRSAVHVDEELRQVWFMASGLRSQEDPYHQHLCRSNFDGTGFVQLTAGDGDHKIEFSPDRKVFIDRWSRVDQPQVSELRRSLDGTLICELERADISLLTSTGWTVPERIVAKGRDDKSDIYGILIKPSHFDPSKKYPVLEEVYAGPHSSFTPKSFGRLTRQHTLAELGFIVVQVDGMGTDNRGKAFHKVSWKNLEDAGFADRKAWIRSAAATRPWMDLSRVGIYGGSAGGQTAMRALIDHSDLYSVAVADCGCHDNRMDKIWWNEQWLGWPVDDSYVKGSNVEHAHRIQGKLMLIVGELDTNVDPASTFQVVGALQKANKMFDFVPVIGAGHGAAETPYGSFRRMDFLYRNLVMPRDRNAN